MAALFTAGARALPSARALLRTSAVAPAVRRPARGLANVVRARLDELAEDRGEAEVLQYEGMKWTVCEAKKYADGLAAGLGELAVGNGDAVATLIPGDAPESHCGQIAAASAGFVYVRDALAETGAKVVIHSGSEADVALLEAAVPEFSGHAARKAAPFHSPAAPSLKYFVSTGLDMHPASSNYQHLLAVDGPKPSGDVADDALLYVAYGAGGVEKFSHKEVVQQNVFPALSAVLHVEHATF